jgi:hypothetical protein
MVTSHGRLEKITPFQTIEWYHGIALLALIVLSDLASPLPLFFILSTMANNAVIGQMFLKSVLSYVVAVVVVSVFAVSKAARKEK